MAVTSTTNLALIKPTAGTNEPASIFTSHNPNMDAIDAHHHGANSGVAIKRVHSGTFAARPAAGNAGHVYIATDTGAMYFDTGAAWVLTGFVNPMTTAGDTIYGGASGVPTRLAAGTARQVKAMNAAATALEYVGGAGGVATFANAADVGKKLQVGTTSHAFSAQTNKSVAVTFPTAFGVAPNAVASCGPDAALSGYFQIVTIAVTTTGMTVMMTVSDIIPTGGGGTAVTMTVGASWHAIG